MLTKAESPGLKSRMDWALVMSIVGLVLIGSVAVLSAASPLPFYARIIQTHFTAFALGTVFFLIGAGLNYQLFSDHSKILYAVALIALVAVLIFGQTVKGQKSWFRLPYFSFQPSEFARICLILVLASFLDKGAQKIHTLGGVLMAGAVVGPVLVLIMKQPDFSSTLIFFPMVLAMLFCAGASISHLASAAGYGALTLGLPLVWTLLSLRPEMTAASPTLAFIESLSQPSMKLAYAIGGIVTLAVLIWRLFALARMSAHWMYFAVSALIVTGGLLSAVAVNDQIKSYQRKRFLAFLAPEVDPQGAAYNVNQALVAIGSGGVAGKGVFSGTQSRLGFLPERHTDFIYAVVGEEMGFWGASLVLIFYLVLIWRVVSAARLSRDRYGFLVCCGIAAMFASHLLINVGMCLGIFPVAGVPLPLLSYGGSSLVMTLWALGIVVNIYSRHYAFA